VFDAVLVEFETETEELRVLNNKMKLSFAR
jgi:hypothetical protein